MLARNAIGQALLFSLLSILPAQQEWSCDMPNNYTPVPTVLSGDVVEPADGDAPTAASVTVGSRKVADGLAYVTQVVGGVLMLVDAQYTQLTPNSDIAAAAFSDLGATMTLTLECVAGDKLIVDVRCTTNNTNDGASAYARVLVNDGGIDISPDEAMKFATSVVAIDQLWFTGSSNFIYTVVNTGTVTIRVQGYSSLGTTRFFTGVGTDFQGGNSLRALQYRQF